MSYIYDIIIGTIDLQKRGDIMKLPVHRIIPFSNVEGLGNRTSIFIQGCNANCLYCHNSETIPMKSNDSKMYSIEELVNVVKNQIPFIRGITVSGGEATLYHKFIKDLFDEIHKLGLTCYIDTNGFFEYSNLLPLIESTDKFLYDIKGLGPSLDDLCFSNNLVDIKQFIRNSNTRFGMNSEHLHNLEQLLENDKVEEVRLVIVKNHYDINYVIDEIYQRLINYPNVVFKIIKMHTRGLPVERLKLLKGAIPSSKDFKNIVTYIESKGFSNLQFIE